MKISLTQDFRTLDELESDPRSVVKHARESGPVVVTVNGKPDVVILSAAQYEWDQHRSRLKKLIAEGEEDIAAGRVQSLEDFAKEIGCEDALANGTSE